MADVELFFKEKLNPLYRAHYGLWVHWWPLWRDWYSGRKIQQKWRQFNLVKEGQTFLDYGCGTGSFTIPLARMVGARGKVYALDCFPQQLEIVEERARKDGLSNIETVLSHCESGLPDTSIDAVWMCDVFHEIKEKRMVLQELHRVLKHDGALLIYDGMKKRVLTYTDGLFSFVRGEDKFLKLARVQ